jgi:hypothetical protein
VRLGERGLIRERLVAKGLVAAPTNSRRASRGIAEIAGPSAAIAATKRISPVSEPVIAERQSRAVPAARMMVRASTASTRHARKTVMKSADPLTVNLAVFVRCRADWPGRSTPIITTVRTGA